MAPKDAPIRALSLLGVWVSSSLACSSDTFVPLPDLSGAATLLLRATTSSRVSAHAFGPRIELERMDDERHFRAAAYSQTLSELGLSSGVVASENCRSCDLRHPIRVYELDLENTSDPWRVLDDARDDAMIAVLLPDVDRCESCTSFSLETPDRPEGGPVQRALVLPTDGTRALAIVLSDGTAYWVGASGPLEPACAGSATARWTTGYADAVDAVWVAHSSGSLARWDLSRLDPALPCEDAITSSTASVGEPIEAVDGSPMGHPHEVFAIGRSGQIYRYAFGTWTPLGAPSTKGNRIVAWMGPNRGMATADGVLVDFYRDGVHTVAPIVVDGTVVDVNAAKRFDDVGVVLGAKPFILAFEDGAGGWRRIPAHPPTAERVDSLARHAGSYFMILGGGHIRELHPVLGYCPVQLLLPETANRELVALSDGTLVTHAGALRRAKPVRSSSCE